MAKPEDVPQEAWDDAAKITRALPAAWGWSKITEAVARYIMTVQREERERCARLAESFNDASYRVPTNPTALEIARAIRQAPCSTEGE